MSIEIYAIIGGLIGYILGLFICLAVDSYGFKQILKRLDGKPNASKPTNSHEINFVLRFHEQLAEKENENNNRSG